MDIVRENSANVLQTTKDLLAFQFKKVFVDDVAPRRRSIVQQDPMVEKGGIA